MKQIISCQFMVWLTLLCSLQQTMAQAPQPYGVLPSERQLHWQETEMYCIIHFSVATYTDKEWGYGNEDPSLFTAPHFNAEQIVGAAKAAGFKGIVVVAKHHDGFCLWPTKTTTHNISASPYKNGKGDIVKEYEDACKKLDMKMGVYCSPWDRNNALYGKPDYVTDVYRKQLEELYANYGDLFMSWHDGANGGDGFYGGANEVRKIDRSNYYGWDSTWNITRRMQPGACLFGDIGPDVRWVGNEEGYAGNTYWETYTPEAPDEGKQPANGYSKYELATEGTRNGKYWIPAECDVPMRPGWFYHASQDGQSKSAYTLLNLYYKSVGRGACLDLGLSPDKDGLLSDEDVADLKAFGKLLKETFQTNYADGATFTASNIRGTNSKDFSPQNLLDDDRYSYWATDDSVRQPELIMQLKGAKTFNVIRLRENIKLGQRIEGAAVDAWLDNQWREIAATTSIGANRLLTFPAITTNKLRLRITASPVCIALSDVGVFRQPEQLASLIIHKDDTHKVVIANGNDKAVIRYTTNGKNPTAQSAVYQQPFSLPDGGVIKAALFAHDDMKSEISTKQFGVSTAGWKITGNRKNDKTINYSIDENDSTSWSAATNFPVTIVVDMGKLQTVKAFTYLPRQDKKTDGIVNRYQFKISKDGKQWSEVTSGEFANIQSNPVEQLISLKMPVQARYFQFTALSSVDGNSVSVAGLGVRAK